MLQRVLRRALSGSGASRFERAQAAVKLLPSRPSNEHMLKLYALFKMATSGPNTTPEPGFLDFVAAAKWKAWTALGSMSRAEAEEAYIRLCSELGADVDGKSEAGSGTTASEAAESTAREGLRLERSDDGRIVTITLDRPEKRNAITMDMYKGIEETLRETSRDPSARVLVLTGSDGGAGHYSSGNDLSNFTNIPPEGPEKLAADAAEILESFVGAFIDFELPLVAAVNGPSVGIPVTTLGLCDFVYAAHSATFRTPFAALGQSPEACSSVTFPRAMGHARAAEVLLLGKTLTAEQAVERGLVTEVIEGGAFREGVAERVRRIADLPPGAMREGKRVMRAVDRDELHEVNRRECETLRERWVSAECAEAVMAFMSGRR